MLKSGASPPTRDQEPTSTRRCPPVRGCVGFSLIEILVAMTILVILVLIMSNVFHQSTVSWDGGLRKAEGNTTGRAVLGLLARELTEAVCDPRYLGDGTEIYDGASQIRFATLHGTNSATERIVRRLTYAHAGEQVERKEELKKVGKNYGGGWTGPSPVPLGERITRLQFFTPDGANYTGSLPTWVRIELAVKRTDDVSGLWAWSPGPDGKDNTEDDIRTR